MLHNLRELVILINILNTKTQFDNILYYKFCVCFSYHVYRIFYVNI